MPASDVLRRTLDAIAEERGGQFDRSFDLVDRVLDEFGEADLAGRLYDAIPLDTPWELVADLFGILSWSTSDNGAALHRTAEGWLRARADLRRVRIALQLEAYPFLDRSEMEEVLRDVAGRYPEVAARCAELIESRRSPE